MKQFIFWDEDDLSNLPADFKLVPFDVSFLQSETNERPKTSTSEKSPVAPIASISVKPVLSNQNPVD